MKAGNKCRYLGYDLPEYRNQEAVILRWVRFGIYEIQFADGFKWECKREFLFETL